MFTHSKQISISVIVLALFLNCGAPVAQSATIRFASIPSPVKASQFRGTDHPGLTGMAEDLNYFSRGPNESGVYSEDFSTYGANDLTQQVKWNIWSQRLELGYILSRPSKNNGDLAFNSDRQAVLVWSDYRNGNYDIYSQKLDENANQLWASDVRLNSDSGIAHQAEPDITIDGSGQAVVTWTDCRNGFEDCDIYAQKLDGNGNKLWASDVRLNSDLGTTDQSSPAIVVNGSGQVVVVWDDDRNGIRDIYAQKLDGNGNKLWVSDVRVNSGSIGAFHMYPAIAMNGNGQAVVVWQDTRNGYYDIYAQKLDGNGNRLWPSDVRLNSDSGATDQYYPAIAVDAGGQAMVVWQDMRNGNADIYAQKLDGNGSKLWASDVRLNSDSGTTWQYHPSVALDDSGQAVVVWQDERNSNSDIYAMKLDGNGTKMWASDVRANSGSGALDLYCQSYPTIAVDAVGQLVVVWVKDFSLNPDIWENYNGDIYAQKLDRNGSKLWANEVRLNSDTGAADQKVPAIAVDGSGQSIVVWADGRNGNYDIYSQKLNENGNQLWASDVRLNSDTGGAYQSDPAITVDGSGQAVVVWLDTRNGEYDYDIYAQKLDGNGNKLWANDVRLNSDSGTALQIEPAIAVAAGGQVFVMWLDNRNGIYDQDIFAQKLDGNGNKLWASDVRVNSDSGIAYQRYPAIAVDGNGQAIVVWEDERNGSQYFNDDIYAQKLDGNGNKLWASDVRINSDSGTDGQHYPAISIDGSGQAVVVWLDYRNSTNNIYSQKLDGNGNKLWASDVRINSDSGVLYKDYPTVAVDGSGQAVVVWEDFRNLNDDIYAQKLDGNGNKLWSSDVLVNSDSGTADQSYPIIAVDAGGQAVVVWDDDRNLNPDIYAQKLDQLGNKAWSADLPIVYPDVFVYPSGLAQSNSIDTTSWNINSAILTADYTLNSGDVHFSLTNDGGAHWAAVTPGVTHVFTATGSDLRWKTELISDPIRLTSPQITKLRIEYTSIKPIIYLPVIQNALKRLTFGPGRNWQPSFSPDGQKIVFTSNRDGNSEVYVMKIDGTNLTRLTYTPNIQEDLPSFSPDGKSIIFGGDSNTDSEIYLMNADGTNLRNISNTLSSNEGRPRFSPSGTSIVFDSDQSDSWQIYKANIDANGMGQFIPVTNTSIPDKNNRLPSFVFPGNQIVFRSESINGGASSSRIYIINADGTNQIKISTDYTDSYPTVSYDGKWIVFVSDRPNPDLYYMTIEGLSVTRVTTDSAQDLTPAFSQTGNMLAFSSNRAGYQDIYLLSITHP